MQDLRKEIIQSRRTNLYLQCSQRAEKIIQNELHIKDLDHFGDINFKCKRCEKKFFNEDGSIHAHNIHK